MSLIKTVQLPLLLLTLAWINIAVESKVGEISNEKLLYDIEGYVFPPEYFSSKKKDEWLKDTVVHIKGGQYTGFVNADGLFVIPKVPSGSYVIDVISGNYVYEPVRVEINSKGKYRARKVNYLQTSQITPVSYPLKMKPLGYARYFQTREQWRLTDLLFNPMILMMLLPLICIMLLPRVMNDPDAKKDMEQIQNLKNKYDMPEVSEMITSFFGGGQSEKQQAIARSSAGPSNKRKSKNN